MTERNFAQIYELTNTTMKNTLPFIMLVSLLLQGPPPKTGRRSEPQQLP